MSNPLDSVSLLEIGCFFGEGSQEMKNPSLFFLDCRWAQEAPGSNPGAPPKLFKYLAERSISLSDCNYGTVPNRIVGCYTYSKGP